jgi:hypothetical protein
VQRFNPRPLTLDQPEQALPDEAVCAHHPNKRAEAICAGTGDYICSLCAVTVNGQTFSATYLNRPDAQQQMAGKWEQDLPRPDRRIRWLILLSIFPYCQAVAAPIFLIWAGFEYVRMLRMRKAHPLYARLVSQSVVVIAPILILLVAGIWLAVAAAIGLGITEQWSL